MIFYVFVENRKLTVSAAFYDIYENNIIEFLDDEEQPIAVFKNWDYVVIHNPDEG